jgi:FixJ family two-component response regulator
MTDEPNLRTIFVVEDDESMREAIETLLKIAGFGCVAFGSAEAMLARGTADNALCVISDLRLPAMSGLDLMSEMRLRNWRVPVIIITGHDSPANRREAMRRGAAAYLPKPFPGKTILCAIDHISAQQDSKFSTGRPSKLPRE